MEYTIGIIIGIVICAIVSNAWKDSDNMLRRNLETSVGDQMFKAYKAERALTEYKALLRSLLNKVNKVTSNHLHGVPITERQMLALVDRQHEVEESIKASFEGKDYE